ncbi:MAG: hypothetical protein P4M13_00005 [Alphaproteobacteria bacterium]|nr:hypothetical protein [Alphaproteobacteria bacterium]
MGHFTFSMWQDDVEKMVRQVARNIFSSLKEDGHLIMALSELHNPDIRNVDYFHNIICPTGFSLENSLRTWDVYDLSYDFRNDFLTSKRPVRIDKKVVLCDYARA